MGRRFEEPLVHFTNRIRFHHTQYTATESNTCFPHYRHSLTAEPLLLLPSPEQRPTV
jgi:hypothetical protein